MEVPFQMNRMQIEAVYQSFKGWNKNISAVSSYENMPDEMKVYIDFINTYLGVPVKYISNGPGREQIVSA
jgi:adenylosuccinate synthase